MSTIPHPYASFNRKDNPVSDHTDRFDACLKHIDKAFTLPGCPRLDTRKTRNNFSTCSCLHVLKGEDNRSLRNAVAEYMLYHYSKEPEKRQQTIMKWMKELLERKALDSKPQFSLPLNRSDDRSDSDGDLPKIQICRGALGHLLDFKDCKWRRMIKAVKNDEVLHHGNKGRDSQFTKEVKPDLHKYIEKLMEMKGRPRGRRRARRVRKATATTGLSNRNDSIIELPSNLSMRKHYIRFIEERGWTAETTEKGTIQVSAGSEEEQKRICYWTTFHRYWNKAFPNLRVTPTGLNSFLLSPRPDSASKLERKTLDFVSSKRFLDFYESSFVPIIPLGNPIRMSHQTPQAMRLFFSAPVKTARKRRKVAKEEKRYAYGSLAVLNSTGFDPCEFKTYPFCDDLNEIIRLLTEEVKNHLPPEYTINLDFNHVEAKIYHGEDMYQDENRKPLLDDDGQPIRVDCNYKVNYHGDLCFEDDGKQKSTDTVREDHPIVTVTVGATRKLTFKHKRKSGSKWNDGETVIDFDLDQGSIFILLPNDEKPKKIKNGLHKVQHMARFNNKGVSIALVFRSVKKTSDFDTKTNQLLWKRENQTTQKRVRSHMSKNGKTYKRMKRTTAPVEISGIRENVSNYLSGVKEQKRFQNKQP